MIFDKFVPVTGGNTNAEGGSFAQWQNWHSEWAMVNDVFTTNFASYTMIHNGAPLFTIWLLHLHHSVLQIMVNYIKSMVNSTFWKSVLSFLCGWYEHQSMRIRHQTRNPRSEVTSVTHLPNMAHNFVTVQLFNSYSLENICSVWFSFVFGHVSARTFYPYVKQEHALLLHISIHVMVSIF